MTWIARKYLIPVILLLAPLSERNFIFLFLKNTKIKWTRILAFGVVLKVQ